MFFIVEVDNDGFQILDVNGNPIISKDRGDGDRLGVDATIAPGQSISLEPVSSNVSQSFREYCENGGSEDLRVDGSSSAVDFVVNADATDDIRISEIRFLLTITNFRENGSMFGQDPELTNGILLSIRSNSIDKDLINITLSEHFRELFSHSGTTVDRSGNNDVVSAGIYFGGAVSLVGGSSDYVRVRVRDDLTDNEYKYFTCTVTGIKG